MGISSNPSDQNFLQPTKFSIAFDRLPETTFFCSQANIPGISVPENIQPTPGVNAPLPGSKFNFEPFVMKFKVDEQMLSWTTIQDWLKGYGTPESSSQYMTLQERLRTTVSTPQYSDAILTVYSNKNNPILTVNFNRMFPISLTEIQFDNSANASEIIFSIAVFKYTDYTINRL